MTCQIRRLLSLIVIALGVSACRTYSDVLPTSTSTKTPAPSPTVEPTVEENADESFTGIYLVEPSGDNLRLITEPGVHYNHPHFSPDGRYIAFARTEESDRALMLYNRRSGETDAVVKDSRLIRELAWSPDSKWIAFSLSIDYYSDATVLCTYKLDTGAVTTIADEEGSVVSFAWSPDGKRLEFTLFQGLDEISKLYVYEPDADTTINLVTWEGWMSDPSWSPDSEQIAFSGGHAWRSNHGFGLHRGEVYTICAKGGDAAQLTSHGSNISPPFWSPIDKDKVAYVLYTDLDISTNYFGELHLVNPTQQNSPTLTLLTKLMYLSYPVWSPDGRSIAIHSYQGDNWGGILIRVDTPARTGIMNGKAKWSPDSHSLLVESIGGGVPMAAMRTIHWVELVEPEYKYRQIADGYFKDRPFWQTNAEWAPDGNLIAFTGLVNAPDPAP